MTSDAILAVRFMWTMAIRLLTSIYIPGTNITPLSLIFFLATVAIGLKLLVRLTGVGSVDQTAVTAAKNSNEQYLDHVQNPSWKK